MINENELNISSMSYINKDFQAIYPELLDLVKTLTNRWDPASSNESDPGVVLLKVGALLADHLNYNIDKNILEAFLPSATQEESVRYIAEFGGYTPGYYRSAIGDVNVIYNPKEFVGSFKIPAFSLVISNSDGSITYTQIEDIEILNKNIAATGKFIEGTVQRLSIDSDVITLKNIDNNNRVYFPTQYVAENGIYIWNVQNGQASSDLWVKTNYLYTRPQGTRCYKIDFDSKKGLPYVEFPSDIANLIGNGLMINFIYTAGSYGNISAGELDTIVSLNTNLVKGVDSDDLTVSNPSSINSGAEPETIEEIYRNYKKVVGTFDTLVSLQDYTNAINLSTDEYGQKLISNGVVTDRRVDYNNAINITTNTELGLTAINKPINSFGKFIFKGYSATPPANAQPGWIYSDNVKTYLCTAIITEGATPGPVWEEINSLDYTELSDYLGGMSPYDLIIYALQKYSESDYNSIYYWTALNNSYKQIPSRAYTNNSIDSVENLLIADLDKYKCINHVFNDIKNGDVYCFKNYLPLNITIVPFNKVSTYERIEIINNVRKCISDNFNAAMVNFGEEINYDELKHAIENCDERINYVNIADFEYNTKVMVKSDDPNSLENEMSIFETYDGSTFIADLVAKNILAGRLCLFDFDENFDYQYGQTNCNVYTDINSIKTRLQLNPQSSSAGVNTYKYTLKENEFVEIIYPKYYSTRTYGSYVLYNAHFDNSSTVVLAGTEYTLKPGDSISLYYKDNNGNIQRTTLENGETISPSFNLEDFYSDSSYTYTKDADSYKQIAANESISVRELMATTFSTNKNVYWVMNNTSNTLFNGNETEIVLGDNEFFIYTDAAKQYLTILGRGTKIVRSSGASGSMSLPLTVENNAIRQRIADEGLAADIPFALIDFTDNNLTLTQTNIITLGEDTFIGFETAAATVDYNLQYANNINYTINGSTTKLPVQIDPNFYQIRTRLDLNMNSATPQIIKNETYGKQEIIITSGTESTTIDTNNARLVSNVDLNLIGNVSNVPVDTSLYADFNIAINILQYGLMRARQTVFEATDTLITNTYDGWGVSLDSNYKYFDNTTRPSASDLNEYYQMTSRTEYLSEIPYIIDCSMPGNYYIPFSTVWYNYLIDSEAVINRSYISEIYYSNPEPDKVNNVRIQYTKTDDIGTQFNPLYYGNIGKPVSGNARYVLNNNSVYVYPDIQTPDDKINWYLRLRVANPIPGSYLVLSPLSVTWGFNSHGAGAYGNTVVDRINDIIDKTGSDIQFHWTNIPSNEMAMSIDNLTDPYSFFDKNNVANIISIPQIDLERSSIEIIKSMRK